MIQLLDHHQPLALAIAHELLLRLGWTCVRARYATAFCSALLVMAITFDDGKFFEKSRKNVGPF